MTDHWKGLEFELAELDYQHGRTPSVETIPSLSQTFQYVEIIKVQTNTKFETSWEVS